MAALDGIFLGLKYYVMEYCGSTCYGEDARNLISVVWVQFLVGAMLGVGLIWALTRKWQLTLAGFAVVPVFAGVTALQTKLVVRCEARNKKARRLLWGITTRMFFFVFIYLFCK
jgi:hypothetical protein